MDTAAINGITLEFEVLGTGEAEHSLADRYRLTTYHRRGYLGSSRTPGPISVLQQAADCRGLMGHLGIERVHLVGHSAGGCIALQFALDFPEVVHSLALLEAALMVGESAQAYRESLEGGTRRYREAGAAVVANEFLKARWPLYTSTLEHMLPGGFAQAVTNASATFELDMGLLDWHFDVPEARRITQPTLVVLGGESIALSPRFEETYRFLLDHKPRAEGFVLPGTTHFLHLENLPAAADMAEALAKFWGRHPVTP